MHIIGELKLRPGMTLEKALEIAKETFLANHPSLYFDTDLITPEDVRIDLASLLNRNLESESRIFTVHDFDDPHGTIFINGNTKEERLGCISDLAKIFDGEVSLTDFKLYSRFNLYLKDGEVESGKSIDIKVRPGELTEDAIIRYINENNFDMERIARSIFETFLPIDTNDYFKICQKEGKLCVLTKVPLGFAAAKGFADLPDDKNEVMVCDVSPTQKVVLVRDSYKPEDYNRDDDMLRSMGVVDSLGNKWQIESERDSDGDLKALYAVNENKDRGEIYVKFDSEKELELDFKEGQKAVQKPKKGDEIENIPSYHNEDINSSQEEDWEYDELDR